MKKLRFLVKTVDDDKTVVSMEALFLSDVPDPKTVTVDVAGYDRLADVVKDYITMGLNVEQIASRLTGYHYYVDYEPKVPGKNLDEKIENVRRRAHQGREQPDDQTPVQKDDEVTITGTGLISKADEE